MKTQFNAQNIILIDPVFRILFAEIQMYRFKFKIGMRTFKADDQLTFFNKPLKAHSPSVISIFFRFYISLYRLTFIIQHMKL